MNFHYINVILNVVYQLEDDSIKMKIEIISKSNGINSTENIYEGNF